MNSQRFDNNKDHQAEDVSPIMSGLAKGQDIPEGVIGYQSCGERVVLHYSEGGMYVMRAGEMFFPVHSQVISIEGDFRFIYQF